MICGAASLLPTFPFLTRRGRGGPSDDSPVLTSGSSDIDAPPPTPDFHFPSGLDTHRERKRAPEVVYKPENSSLSENVRQHMSAEDNKIDPVISAVGVEAILFLSISS